MLCDLDDAQKLCFDAKMVEKGIEDILCEVWTADDNPFTQSSEEGKKKECHNKFQKLENALMAGCGIALSQMCSVACPKNKELTVCQKLKHVMT